MAAPGDRLGGRYELIEVIGAGGMAVVWRARDARLRRTVAVKILRPQFAEDAEFVERFESEARHAAGLAHPNVATVYDTGFDPGPDGGTRYIVMELVDGPSVAELLRHGPLPVSLAIDVASAAARALAAAHRRGIVHRDVKPGNLLVGSDGRVRLSDFGIARALTSSRLTTAGEALGSLPYMSPEQAAGEEVLPQSDIYSLGVVLFEMLHGRLPAREARRVDDSAAVDDSGTPDAALSEDEGARPGVRTWLAPIIARALQRDPVLRHPSARALAEALEAVSNRSHRAGVLAIDNGTAAGSTATPRLARKRKRRRPAAPPSATPQGAASTDPSPTPPGAMTGGVPAIARERPFRTPTPDRRRRDPAVIVTGLTLLAGATVFVLAVLANLADVGGAVLSATATPPPSIGGPIAAATANPSESGSPIPTAVSVAPSASRAPSPTVAATPRPTPRPTQRPSGGGPTQAVADFYDAVASHDWDRAISRWSERMQRRYPPDEWLIGRFSRTTRIDITRLRRTALDPAAGTATVAVTIVEYRTVEPSPRTFSGTWDLVRVGGRWLLDAPHF
jgi:serine/threonine-protein kinase